MENAHKTRTNRSQILYTSAQLAVTQWPLVDSQCTHKVFSCSPYHISLQHICYKLLQALWPAAFVGRKLKMAVSMVSSTCGVCYITFLTASISRWWTPEIRGKCNIVWTRISTVSRTQCTVYAALRHNRCYLLPESIHKCSIDQLNVTNLMAVFPPKIIKLSQNRTKLLRKQRM